MRYLLWAGLATMVLGAALVYWGAKQCCAPATVAEMPFPPNGSHSLSTCPARSKSSATHVEQQAVVKTWSSEVTVADHEPERVPEAAYGPPVATDPQEVIQVQRVDPKMVEAMAQYLAQHRPQLDTCPNPIEDTGSAEVVVHVLGSAAGSAEDSEPNIRMPRCAEDEDETAPARQCEENIGGDLTEEEGTGPCFIDAFMVAPHNGGCAAQVGPPTPRMPCSECPAHDCTGSHGCHSIADSGCCAGAHPCHAAAKGPCHGHAKSKKNPWPHTKKKNIGDGRDVMKDTAAKYGEWAFYYTTF
jgi:hypothetical protein